jgi:hypothetical protein
MTQRQARLTAEQLGWHFEDTWVGPRDSCPKCWPGTKKRWEEAMNIHKPESPSKAYVDGQLGG